MADPNSNLAKVLTSSAFKDSSKNQEADQIDAVYLKVFGLIHCSGKPIDKTNAFYEILQDGGYDQHEQISAGDKDFPPVFQKICEFVTVDAMKLAVQTGCADSEIYSEDEQKKLTAEDVIEVVREEIWLEDVFGANSRLTSDVWADNVSKKANWIFDPKETRKKLFSEAKVTIKH